ncbi:hypothetical protein PM8797T_24146 [Gimesia maris DSM 8797]|nr:hypothetical protein PM8797T_24146 [Gimesia maris DSM 8797]
MIVGFFAVWLGWTSVMFWLQK